MQVVRNRVQRCNKVTVIYLNLVLVNVAADFSITSVFASCWLFFLESRIVVPAGEDKDMSVTGCRIFAYKH